MIECAKCGSLFRPDHRKTTYCTAKCRASEYKEAYSSKNTNYGVSTGTVGAIHELVACADLLKRGYEVFRAVSPSCSCDVAVMINKKLIRVEVTTGHKTAKGNLFYPPKDRAKHDLLAVVHSGGMIEYLPPLSTLCADVPPESQSA